MSNWKVPFIDLEREYQELIKDGLLEDISKVLLSGRYVLGEELKTFEDSMADYLRVGRVLGVNSGTDAMILALKVCGIKKEHEIITVAHTFPATIAAIKHVGATPILVDIGPDFNIDVDKIEKTITEKTKVILPVHLNGRSCNMDKIVRLAITYNLLIVEDACQALGARYMNQLVGTFGIGCFSTHPLKTLSSAGDGGFVVTNLSIVEEQIELLRNHGTTNKVDFTEWGYNSRLDEIQASILLRKLSYLNTYITKRRDIADNYEELLLDINQIILPPATNNSSNYYDTYNSYTIRANNRDKLKTFLTSKGVETLISWKKPVYLNKNLGLDMYIEKLPNTEKASKEVISLPIFPQMRVEEVIYVADCIKEFYGQ